ncbi:hypothetical protein BDN72DRAFT_130228 [Pluteus cervinus]|uniref:Uncharacterized protein n=1 Tax=Pluteus cervinus TaxID=181527 RepID=A0ACD3AM04_9AGAR|nr:hypothetical protein BDN72DRAFT_130228 [Pluteus cervinus]
MAPTQTHILIRAPTGFVYPAWVPKQNMKSTVDGTLERFLEESFPVPLPSLLSASASLGGLDDQKKRMNGNRNGNKAKDKGKVEGHLGCLEQKRGYKGVWFHGQDEGGDRQEEDEDNEMIWWSWDGKLDGLSDW